MQEIQDAFAFLSSTSWTTILTLASGYAGYFVAHVGQREHHQQLDQAFRVIFYGFWGIFAYMALRAYGGVEILVASAISVVGSAALGAFWRKWGKRALSWLLRRGNISMSDDVPTAWAALFDVGDVVDATQLKVCLTDGTHFFCDDFVKFADQPNGPCILGGQGDVLMYVTQIGKNDDAGKRIWVNVDSGPKPGYGSAITYIPREQIARVELRRMPRRKTQSSVGGGGAGRFSPEPVEGR